MNAQPATIGFQFTSATAARMDEIINKLQELGSGTGVGANLYLGTNELKARFGDHAHGCEHLVLAPQEMLAVRSYMDQRNNPDDKKVRTLLAEADAALIRAGEYAREQHGKLSLKSA